MSDWKTQNNGVKTRVKDGRYEIIYPDGRATTAFNIVDLAEKVNAYQPPRRDKEMAHLFKQRLSAKIETVAGVPICSNGSSYQPRHEKKERPEKVSNEPLTIIIPGKPPTSNTAYETLKNGRRRLSTKGKNYKKLVKSIVGDHRRPERKYQYTMTVYWKWDTTTKQAKCEVEAADLASCEKLIIDAIFDTLMPGVYQPDKWVYHDSHTKIHEPDKSKHRTIVTIEPWKGE